MSGAKICNVEPRDRTHKSTTRFLVENFNKVSSTVKFHTETGRKLKTNHCQRISILTQMILNSTSIYDDSTEFNSMDFYQELSFKIFDHLPLNKLYKLRIYFNNGSEFLIQFSNRIAED